METPETCYFKNTHNEVDSFCCVSCGFVNPEFSEGSFFQFEGKTIEQAREDCRNGHPKLMEMIRRRPTDYLDQYFCEYCGARYRVEVVVAFNE